MELANGSLRDVLSDRRGYPTIAWSVRLRLLADIAQGMAKLHSLRPCAIIHRDLKAANVLLSSADLQVAVAKICDFGLAKAAETVRTTASASGGGMAGSLPWKAPETFRGKYTAKSDVYGFAVVGFEVLTRSMPFEGHSETEIIGKLNKLFDPQDANVLLLVQHKVSTVERLRADWHKANPLDSRRPDLSLAEAGCPEALCAIIARCWADEPNERPEFAECLAALKAVTLPRTFATSHFKREYEKSSDKSVDHATQVFASVADFIHAYCRVHGLVSAEHKVLESSFVAALQHKAGKRPEVEVLGKAGVTAELLWTSAERFEGMSGEHNTELSSLLNAAIRSDHEQLMPSAAGLARSINTLCVVGRTGMHRDEFPHDGVTFRGTGFDNDCRPFFDEPNKKYRAPGFLATSFSEQKAKEFAYNNGTALARPAVLWVVHVDPRGQDSPDYRCKHVNFVRHSLVSGEHEYLFTAYSAFMVRKVEWAEGDELSRIEIEALLDNQAEPEDLPLAPWY
jgi:serine/threonine protein kinase